MPDITLSMTGGAQFTKKLAAMAAKIGEPEHVRAGFLEDAKYPDGTPVAYIAAINEFGGSWQMPARMATIYRKISVRTGGFLRGGRFVKRKVSNYATDHAVGAYTHTQPPRPFFRNMIAAKKGGWGAQLGDALKAARFDTHKALAKMGAEIEGQLSDSIETFTSPPLAKSTIKAKGFAQPLIGGARDSGGGGVMAQSTGYELTGGTQE